MADNDPTFYEMPVEQEINPRADRSVWQSGDLQQVENIKEQEEEEEDYWESYWDQTR